MLVLVVLVILVVLVALVVLAAAMVAVMLVVLPAAVVTMVGLVVLVLTLVVLVPLRGRSTAAPQYVAAHVQVPWKVSGAGMGPTPAGIFAAGAVMLRVQDWGWACTSWACLQGR